VGLNENRRFQARPGVEIAFLGDGDTEIELICDSKNEGVKIGQDISLGFVTHSLDSMMQFVKEKGMGIHSGPIQPNAHIRFFYVLDPNRLKIQFVENI
jgi:lactoylglutathione lyase